MPVRALRHTSIRRYITQPPFCQNPINARKGIETNHLVDTVGKNTGSQNPINARKGIET